jgi:hypothetical protein
MIVLGTGVGGDPLIGQAPTSPLVYLDHFAVRAAEKQRERFAKALKKSGGTWAMSWVNFLEFAETSEGSVASAEALISECVPNILFFDVESGAVIERENRALRGEFDGYPFLHRELANLYVMLPGRTSLNPLEPTGFVAAWRTPHLRTELKRLSDEAATMTTKMFEEARKKRTLNREVRRNLDRRPLPVRKRIPPTRYVVSETMKLMVKSKMNFKDGHNLRDFWHMVVPISYCDFVLLDKNWREIARQVGEKLADAAAPSRTGEVLSSVDALIERIERIVPL